MRRAIRKLEMGKAPSVDGVTAKILKARFRFIKIWKIPGYGATKAIHRPKTRKEEFRRNKSSQTSCRN